MAKKEVEKKEKLSHEDFVEIWQKAENIEEVVEKTGWDEKKARAHASLLRMKGVDALKKFRRKTTDYKALNEKAEDLV